MKKFDAEITAVKKVSPRVRIFEIKTPDDFDFAPGQFVIASVPGFNNDNGLPVKRSYSIASAPPSRGSIELCISLAPEGKFSGKIGRMSAGESIAIEGPFGSFKLSKPVPANASFIAGGTGISPLMSMIRSLYLENHDKPLHLYYGIRTEEDFLYREELEAYARNKTLRLVVAASEDENWKGEKGYISDVAGKLMSGQQAPVYVCGPPPMLKPTMEKLKEKGFRDEQIIREQW